MNGKTNGIPCHFFRTGMWTGLRWYMGGGWEEDYGPAGQEMLRWTCLMEALCPKERTGNSLEMCGDTAVISFDTFTDDGSSDYYYLSLPGAEEWESDTFGFLYQCFDILSAVPEVRRVVIDLSNNGGGDVTALAAALGFLSKDGEVTLTYRNTFTGSYNDDRFHVDTNLDGVADSRDGWGDRYEFYIVTSGSTYSCGHAMAFFAAKQGLARVVGRQGGGGDCTVGLWYDAAGILASYSGCIQLGVMERGRFVSSEGNVPMAAEWGGGKYALDAPWYSPEGIVDFLDRLEAGDEAA